MMKYALHVARLTPYALLIAAVFVWHRSYTTCDDLWYLTPPRTRTVGVTSTRGQLAVLSTRLDGPGEFAPDAGFRFDQHPPMNLATFSQPGRPTEARSSIAGFLFRRFDATPCSTTAVGSTTRLTVLAVPYWSLVLLLSGPICFRVWRRFSRTPPRGNGN